MGGLYAPVCSKLAQNKRSKKKIALEYWCRPHPHGLCKVILVQMGSYCRLGIADVRLRTSVHLYTNKGLLFCSTTVEATRGRPCELRVPIMASLNCPCYRLNTPTTDSSNSSYTWTGFLRTSILILWDKTDFIAFIDNFMSDHKSSVAFKTFQFSTPLHQNDREWNSGEVYYRNRAATEWDND